MLIVDAAERDLAGRLVCLLGGASQMVSASASN